MKTVIARDCFSILYYNRNKNQREKIWFKRYNPWFITEKSDIQIILCYIIFIHFNMFLHVNRKEVNNVIDTLHVTTDTNLLYSKSMV